MGPACESIVRSTSGTFVQKLSCLPYVFLPVYSVFKCFRSSHLAICVRFCSCLCTVCSNVSEALMLAICVRSCYCPCIVCSLFLFLPVQSLLTCFKSFFTRFADFVPFLTNNLIVSQAFLRFIAFSGSPTAVHHAFLFSDAKAWPQSHTDLHVHYSITLWACLSAAPVKDSHKCLSSTQCVSKSRDHTLSLRTWGIRH